MYVYGMSSKTMENIAVTAHPNIGISNLYSSMKRMPHSRAQISRLVKLLSISEGLSVICSMCRDVVSNLPIHLFIYCVELNDVRNVMWDELIDILGVTLWVILGSKLDVDLVAIFLGANWELEDEGVFDKVVSTVAKYYGHVYELCLKADDDNKIISNDSDDSDA